MTYKNVTKNQLKGAVDIDRTESKPQGACVNVG